jgi:hypothetical protein
MIFLFLGIGIFSCKDNEPEAPILPPQSAFVADFSDFNSSGKIFVKETFDSWAFSAVNVTVWSVIVNVGLAVPVASYVEAVKNHDPLYQSDNTWLWTYDFNVGLATYTAKLFGTIDGENVIWEMYISKTGDFTDFLWYKGTCDINATQGTWILYNNPDDATELLEITWNNNTDGTGNIKYMNVVPGGPENGGYIAYGNDLEGDFNAWYDIYNKGLDNLTKIEWNIETKNGRVSDFDHFADDAWHCWNESLYDYDCPL